MDFFADESARSIASQACSDVEYTSYVDGIIDRYYRTKKDPCPRISLREPPLAPPHFRMGVEYATEQPEFSPHDEDSWRRDTPTNLLSLIRRGQGEVHSLNHRSSKLLSTQYILNLFQIHAIQNTHTQTNLLGNLARNRIKRRVLARVPCIPDDITTK